MTLFSGVREIMRTLLATQPSRHSGLEAPRSAQEQGSSHVVHMGSADPGILATRALEHGRLLIVDGDVLLQTRRTVGEETSRFLHRESAPVTVRFFTQRTDQ